MTHVPVVLALGLIFAGVARPASPVAVLLQFDAPYSAPALQAMQREVDSIMRPAGYRLEWHLLDADIAGREFPDLVVVHFQGRCEAGALAGTVKNGESLASTAVSDGRVLPFSEVHCDQVRRFIGPGAPKAIGRALGRIVAHEMFHMLTASGQHGKVGVARSAQTTQELVANRELRFDPADLEMLRETHRYPKALPKFPPPGTM
jgi:hypothetical protein